MGSRKGSEVWGVEIRDTKQAWRIEVHSDSQKDGV